MGVLSIIIVSMIVFAFINRNPPKPANTPPLKPKQKPLHDDKNKSSQVKPSETLKPKPKPLHNNKNKSSQIKPSETLEQLKAIRRNTKMIATIMITFVILCILGFIIAILIL